MSDTDHEYAIHRWFEAVNQGDLALLERLSEELFTPDFVEHDPRMQEFVPGPASVKNFTRQLLAENRDVHVSVQDIFSYGDRTAYRFTVSMTKNTSDTPLVLQVLAITRFVDGRFAEEWQLCGQGLW